MRKSQKTFPVWKGKGSKEEGCAKLKHIKDVQFKTDAELAVLRHRGKEEEFRRFLTYRIVAQKLNMEESRDMSTLSPSLKKNFKDWYIAERPFILLSLKSEKRLLKELQAAKYDDLDEDDEEEEEVILEDSLSPRPDVPTSSASSLSHPLPAKKPAYQSPPTSPEIPEPPKSLPTPPKVQLSLAAMDIPQFTDPEDQDFTFAPLDFGTAEIGTVLTLEGFREKGQTGALRHTFALQQAAKKLGVVAMQDIKDKDRELFEDLYQTYRVNAPGLLRIDSAETLKRNKDAYQRRLGKELSLSLPVIPQSSTGPAVATTTSTTVSSSVASKGKDVVPTSSVSAKISESEKEASVAKTQAAVVPTSAVVTPSVVTSSVVTSSATSTTTGSATPLLQSIFSLHPDALAARDKDAPISTATAQPRLVVPSLDLPPFRERKTVTYTDSDRAAFYASLGRHNDDILRMREYNYRMTGVKHLNTLIDPNPLCGSDPAYHALLERERIAREDIFNKRGEEKKKTEQEEKLEKAGRLAQGWASAYHSKPPRSECEVPSGFSVYSLPKIPKRIKALTKNHDSDESDGDIMPDITLKASAAAKAFTDRRGSVGSTSSSLAAQPSSSSNVDDANRKRKFEADKLIPFGSEFIPIPSKLWPFRIWPSQRRFYSIAPLGGSSSTVSQPAKIPALSLGSSRPVDVGGIVTRHPYDDFSSARFSGPPPSSSSMLSRPQPPLSTSAFSGPPPSSSMVSRPQALSSASAQPATAATSQRQRRPVSPMGEAATRAGLLARPFGVGVFRPYSFDDVAERAQETQQQEFEKKSTIYGNISAKAASALFQGTLSIPKALVHRLDRASGAAGVDDRVLLPLYLENNKAGIAINDALEALTQKMREHLTDEDEKDPQSAFQQLAQLRAGLATVDKCCRMICEREKSRGRNEAFSEAVLYVKQSFPNFAVE